MRHYVCTLKIPNMVNQAAQEDISLALDCSACVETFDVNLTTKTARVVMVDPDGKPALVQGLKEAGYPVLL